MGWRLLLGVSIAAHLPQAINMAKGQSMKEARVYSEKNGTFWTPETILWHAGGAIALLIPDPEFLKK